jgi:PIN domain nuclease of toxin-antitoxin system
MRLLRLSILAVEMRHVIMSARIPLHHRDPFDRMLIAQASIEGVPILIADAAIARYPVHVIW